MAVTDTGRVTSSTFPSVAIYGRVIITQERRGPGSVVQVADSVYPEEEVGMG